MDNTLRAAPLLTLHRSVGQVGGPVAAPDPAWATFSQKPFISKGFQTAMGMILIDETAGHPGPPPQVELEVGLAVRYDDDGTETDAIVRDPSVTSISGLTDGETFDLDSYGGAVVLRLNSVGAGADRVRVYVGGFGWPV